MSITILKRLWVSVIVWWRHRHTAAAPVPRKNKKVKIASDPGANYATIRELLGDLDTVFKDLKKLKPQRHDTQRIVRRHGPYIANFNKNSKDNINADELEGFSVFGLPSVLILWLNRFGPGDTKYIQEFFVAVKFDKLLHYARPNCVYYEMTHIWLPDWLKKPMEGNCIIEVNKISGQVIARPLPQVEQSVIPSKKTPGNPSVFSRKTWMFPALVEAAITDPSVKNKAKYLEDAFRIVYNAVFRRELGINIIAKKGNERVTFTIPQHRCCYFFKERMDSITASGRKRPIYHAVVAHQRHLATGTVNVKTHYRGSRRFKWGDYNIVIAAPKSRKAVRSQSSFDVSAVYADKVKRGYVSTSGPTVKNKILPLFEPEQS